MTGTPLPVVYPLGIGEVEEFLAFYAPQDMGPYRTFGHRDKVTISVPLMINTDRVFRSVSGRSQGLIWRVRQQGALNDSNIAVALSRVRLKCGSIWDDSSNDHKVIEELLRSWLLVAEKVHAMEPTLIKSMDAGEVQRILEDAVGEFFYRGQEKVEVRELNTVEEVAAVAVNAVYLMTVIDEKGTYVAEHIFHDTEDRRHTGLAPRNKVLGQYVKDHPEQAVRIGEIVKERNVGRSEEEAAFVIEQLALPAPAVSDGFL